MTNTEPQTTPGFASWAIVEIMGHQTFAGHVSEKSIAGTVMLQVDVPEVDGRPAFTRFFGGGAIYSITPVSEEVARAAAAGLRPRPVTTYIPALERSSHPQASDGHYEGRF